MNDNTKMDLINTLLSGERKISRCILDREELECNVYLLHIENDDGACYSVLEINGVERFWIPEDEEEKLLKWWKVESLKRKGEDFAELGKEAIGGGWMLCESAEDAKEMYLSFRLSSIGRYAEAEYYKDMFFVVQQDAFSEETADDFVSFFDGIGIAGLFYFRIDDGTQKLIPVKDKKVIFKGKEEDNTSFMDSGIGIGFFSFSSNTDYSFSKDAYDISNKLYDDPVFKEFRKNLIINWNYPFTVLIFGGAYNFSVLSDIIEEIACYVRTGEMLVVDSEGHLVRYLFRNGNIETFDLPRPRKKD